MGLLLWSMIACGPEFGFDPIESDTSPVVRTTVTDRFVQANPPAVDVLIVVDDTASMAQEQEALAEAFDDLVSALDEVGVDWQIGLTSMDVVREDAGWLLGNPWILSPSVSVGLPSLGTAGTGPEAGLGAALLALELAGPGGPNEGFRRDSAALHVLFVSDADDASDTVFEGDPVAGFLSALADEGNNGLPAVAWAVVGDAPLGCSGPDGSAVAGTRYVDVVTQSGGGLSSVCEPDVAPFVAALGASTAVWATEFPLSHVPAGLVVVIVDDVAVADGWTVAEGVVRFDAPPGPGAEIVVTYVVEVP